MWVWVWVWVEGWGGQYGCRDIERVKATGPWPVEGRSQKGIYFV